MGNNPQIFECGAAELHRGISLIEASAGTGKTYAISMLVLRFVAEQDVPVEKILVVTFTIAATEELRGRIRAKLVEGRDGLLGRLDKPDPTMQQWLDTIKVKGIGEQATARLTLALAEIDLLPVFTIHGFCQRMLIEQALESGQLFDSELLADISRLRLEVVEDYWRQHLYHLDKLSCSCLLSHFHSPQELWQSISKAVGVEEIIPVCDSFSEAHSIFLRYYQTAYAWWREHGAALLDRMRQAQEDGKFKGALKADFDRIIQKIEVFFSDKESCFIEELEYLLSDNLIEQLNGNKFRKASKEDFIQSLQLPAVIEKFMAAGHAMVDSFRIRLANTFRTELDKRLAQKGRMSFDDLISRLAAAVEGENRKSLIRLVNDRFRVALIDEFQDTDSSQWKIFHSFFGNGQHSLYLIGDPKQAIYKFRGADIYSYFEAKNRARYHLTLEKNFRSHPYLVEEVNALFDSHDQPFLFDGSRMDYQPVTAAKDENEIFLEKDSLREPAVVYGVLDKSQSDSGRWNKGEASAVFLQHMVAEIARLLDKETPVFLVEKEIQQILQPKDIAILVRSHYQAEQCQQLLAEHGYPTVIGSKKSVYETIECRDFCLLLQGVAVPGDVRRMKAAMSISWFGLSGDQLAAIFENDELIDQLSYRFMHYYQLWQEKGFLAMINNLLHHEKLLITIGGQRFSERRMTNILHLAELIQQKESDERYTISQLVQWLLETVQDPASQEASELRLESDEDAIQIVTMHGSKGLEYPVVFCPYLWDNRQGNSKESQVVFHDSEQNCQVLDLGSAQFSDHYELARQEELAEDVRLLYVALTRAAVKLYVFWGDISFRGFDSFQSALGHILFNRQRVDRKQQEAVFAKRLRQDRVLVEQIAVKGFEIASYRKKDATVELAPVPAGNGVLQTNWQVSSFSALSALSEEETLPFPVILEKGDSVLVTDLPAGAGFGNVVHDALEYTGFHQIAAGQLSVETLSLTCTRYGVTASMERLQQLLINVVQTPLFDSQEPVTLADLKQSRVLKEMEFYFSLAQCDTDRVNTLLAHENTVSNLSHRALQGYLTGFIDLIFEHNGQFFIVDYKSNNLGEYQSDYRLESLVNGMAAHNYGLQYWIYTAVLHRFLEQNLPAYNYEEHFGGVLYLFVRGMNPEIPGSGIFNTIPDKSCLDKLLDILEGKG